MMTNADVVSTWFTRVWEEQDISAIDELMATDAQAIGLGKQTLVGPEAFKVFHAELCKQLTDFKITIDKNIVDGEWISSLMTFEATSKKTGKFVSITGNIVGRIVEGKIVQGYNHFDFMGMWEQLDLLPEGSFEKGLCGERIG